MVNAVFWVEIRAILTQIFYFLFLNRYGVRRSHRMLWGVYFNKMHIFEVTKSILPGIQ